MSGDFVQTNRSGVFKEQSSTPGKYESGDMGRTVLPETSGLGGFGGPGEYMKYPEVTVQKFNMDKDGVEKTGEDTVPEVNFLSPPPDSSTAPDRGVHEAEEILSPTEAVVEEPVTKKRKRTSKKKDIPVEKYVPVTMVTFSGDFGETTVPYEKVFFSGITLVLIAETDGSVMLYSPPRNDVGFDVEFDNNTVRAYSVGISFMFPDTTKKVTVLLVDGKNDS